MSLPDWTEPNDLDEATATINNLGRNMHEHAFIIGRTLIWTKRKLPHSDFLPWIENNVWFGPRTAQRMIGFARMCLRKGQLLSYVQEKSDFKTHLTEPVNFPGKYHTIVVDPPWAYGNNSGRQKMDYAARTMTWSIVRGWGFEPKTSMVWVK